MILYNTSSYIYHLIYLLSLNHLLSLSSSHYLNNYISPLLYLKNLILNQMFITFIVYILFKLLFNPIIVNHFLDNFVSLLLTSLVLYLSSLFVFYMHLLHFLINFHNFLFLNQLFTLIFK
jgi:hypothetical protein